MMSFLRGMALTITDGWPISLYDIAKEYPVLFQLGQGKIGQIPMQAICMIVIMGVLFFVLSNTPFGAIRKGIAYIPSDRKQEGLILIQSVGINTVLSILRKIARFGVLPSMKVYNVAKNYTTKLDVRCASMAQKVIYLSGGNQQKVVLSKSLVIHPKVMLMNEPTRGIDVGAKQEIYKLMLQLATEGMSIIFISSELPEIMALSDRILVIYSGKVKGEFIPEKTTKEELLALACGSNQKH